MRKKRTSKPRIKNPPSVKKTFERSQFREAGLFSPGQLLGSSAKTRKSEAEGYVTNQVLYLAPDARSMAAVQGALARIDSKGNIPAKFRFKGPASGWQATKAVILPGESRADAYAAQVVLNRIAQQTGQGAPLKAALLRNLGNTSKARTTCTHASGCSSVCLVDSGRGGSGSVNVGRLNKTLLFLTDKTAFVDALHGDVNRLCKRVRTDVKQLRADAAAVRAGKMAAVKARWKARYERDKADSKNKDKAASTRQQAKDRLRVSEPRWFAIRNLKTPAAVAAWIDKEANDSEQTVIGVRLNGTSDISWEELEGSRGFATVEPEACPACVAGPKGPALNLQFYDYTKSPPSVRQNNLVRLNKARAARGLAPVPYSLTFSYDPTTHPFRDPNKLTEDNPSSSFRVWFSRESARSKVPWSAATAATVTGLKKAEVEALLNGEDLDALAAKGLKQAGVKLKPSVDRRHVLAQARGQNWKNARQALDYGKAAQRARKRGQAPAGAQSWSVSVGLESKDLAKRAVGQHWSLFPDVPIIDGDEHDLRFTDEPAIVGLYPKLPRGVTEETIVENVTKMARTTGSFFQRIGDRPSDMGGPVNGYLMSPAEGRKRNPITQAEGYVGPAYKRKYRDQVARSSTAREAAASCRVENA